jgi:hypothetical protein
MITYMSSHLSWLLKTSPLNKILTLVHPNSVWTKWPYRKLYRDANIGLPIHAFIPHHAFILVSLNDYMFMDKFGVVVNCHWWLLKASLNFQSSSLLPPYSILQCTLRSRFINDVKVEMFFNLSRKWLHPCNS